MNKKAALEMSVQSIVIFVITFIVVGLLIALITGMFDQITPSVNRLIGVDLKVPPPSPDNPIVIDGGKLFLRTGGTQEIIFGVYNTRGEIPSGTNYNLTFNITRCSGWQAVPSENLPIIQAKYPLSENISPGEIVYFSTFIKENGLARGEYTCIMEVKNESGPPPASNSLINSCFLMTVS